MVRPRVPETAEGIQEGFTVEVYDQMQRRLRDRGWIETDRIIKSGIDTGAVLEVGPGPGYLGLEWLKKTSGTTLCGLEISENMIQVAEKNAAQYGLKDRVSYILGNAGEMPFGDSTFDAVFSASSLHEWDQPQKIFAEIDRVLKSGGRYFISDFRRDMNPLVKALVKLSTKPGEIRPGLVSSIHAAYTKDELLRLLSVISLKGYEVNRTVMDLEIIGRKPS